MRGYINNLIKQYDMYRDWPTDPSNPTSPGNILNPANPASPIYNSGGSGAVTTKQFDYSNATSPEICDRVIRHGDGALKEFLSYANNTMDRILNNASVVEVQRCLSEYKDANFQFGMMVTFICLGIAGVAFGIYYHDSRKEKKNRK